MLFRTLSLLFLLSLMYLVNIIIYIYNYVMYADDATLGFNL